MSIYHDEIEIEDFDYDEENDVYYYPCPCGDRFEITKVSQGDFCFSACRGVLHGGCVRHPGIFMKHIVKVNSRWILA